MIVFVIWIIHLAVMLGIFYLLDHLIINKNQKQSISFYIYLWTVAVILSIFNLYGLHNMLSKIDKYEYYESQTSYQNHLSSKLIILQLIVNVINPLIA